MGDNREGRIPTYKDDFFFQKLKDFKQNFYLQLLELVQRHLDLKALMKQWLSVVERGITYSALKL